MESVPDAWLYESALMVYKETDRRPDLVAKGYSEKPVFYQKPNAAPRLYVSPPVAGVSHVGTEPVPGRTEYVRADRLDEAVRVAATLHLALALHTCEGCPKCPGDCSSANPPMLDCPTQRAIEAFRQYDAFLAKESDQ